MKNTLLTTTALALTSFAGTASAVEIAAGAVNLEISGFFRATAAISNVDLGAGSIYDGKDYDGFDILTNSEIHFKPSITLDNGIKIGADIELEGNTSSDQIDESTIFAIGGFGRVELGSKDSAGKLMQVGAPDVSMVYANSTSLGSFVPFSGPSTFFDFAGDAERLTYFTPDFGGFKVGLSYARNASQESGKVDNNEEAATDFIDLGITYNGTVGEVGIAFSARYGTSDGLNISQADADDLADALNDVNIISFARELNPTVAGVGLKLGFGDFSIGGGYVEVDSDIGGLSNAKTYDIGVSYANGPMGYSLTYVKGKSVADLIENTSIVAAATYTLNPNFKVGVSLASVETDLVGGTNGDIDGTILALSTQFNF